MASEELDELILHGREERNLEYKAPMSWTSSLTKTKVAKASMAMSNIPDGGAVVLGIEQGGEAFLVKGMTAEDADSFSQDDVQEFVNEYADPYVELTVSQVELPDNRRFVVIQVREFGQLPVVCKKNGEQKLRKGALYTRPRRKYEPTFPISARGCPKDPPSFTTVMVGASTNAVNYPIGLTKPSLGAVN